VYVASQEKTRKFKCCIHIETQNKYTLNGRSADTLKYIHKHINKEFLETQRGNGYKDEWTVNLYYVTFDDKSQPGPLFVWRQC